MRYIEALTNYEKTSDETSLFLAGGISGCPDWQSELAYLLRDEDVSLLNPRRQNFPIHDPKASYDQIKWEHDHLRKADMISFWFPKETLCPIVLYELGAWSMTQKQLFVGIHPEYQRKQDVEIQTGLVRPEISIAYDLESLASEIKYGLRKTR